MRELTVTEVDQVAGGSLYGALMDAWEFGQDVGNTLYESLDPETQDAIGGTIDMALINTGLKEV